MGTALMAGSLRLSLTEILLLTSDKTQTRMSKPGGHDPKGGVEANMQSQEKKKTGT